MPGSWCGAYGGVCKCVYILYQFCMSGSWPHTSYRDCFEILGTIKVMYGRIGGFPRAYISLELIIHAKNRILTCSRSALLTIRRRITPPGAPKRNSTFAVA